MLASSFKVERVDDLGTFQKLLTGSNSEKHLSGVLQYSPLLEFLRGAGDYFCA